MSRSAGIGLLLSALLALTGAASAEAAPVCGPAKARTLATGANARVYISGSKALACQRGSRSAKVVGSRDRVISAWVAGRRAAVVRRTSTSQLLAVYDLERPRSRTQSVSISGTFDAVRLNRGGPTAFVATPPGGAPYIGAIPKGVIAEAAPGVISGTLVSRNGVASWVAQDGIHVRQLFRGISSTFRLARIGDVLVESRNTTVGAELFLRRGGGAQLALGDAIRECGSSQGCTGVDLIQVTDGFAAARTILIDPDRNELWVTVYDLASGTSREECGGTLSNPGRPGSFRLAPDGSVTCSVA